MPDIDASRLPVTLKLITRIFSKIQVSKTHFYKNVPCWEWTAGCSDSGYGRVGYQGSSAFAHRLIYQMFVEVIPATLHCDHLCRRPSCVNPVHIEAVTPDVNRLRSLCASVLNAAKTHCKNGHEFTPENTYVLKSTGMRNCKICTKANATKRHQDIQRLPYDHPKRVKYRTQRNQWMQQNRLKKRNHCPSMPPL